MPIKDFDKIVRTERIAILAGEKIDVSKIPSRVSLEMAKMQDDQDKLNSEDGFYKSIDLVAMACKPSNPKITADWLLDNTDYETLIDFMEYVLEPIKARVEAEEKKQAEALQKKMEIVTKKKSKK